MPHQLKALSKGRRFTLAVFAGYVLLSMLLGERTPFSTYPMYASISHEKVNLVFLADGRPASMFGFTDFTADPVSLDPKQLGFNSSEHFSVEETASYVRQHPRRPDSALPPTEIEIKVHTVRWDQAKGSVESAFRTVYEARARRL